jgi:hypothetical protein
MPDQPTEAAIQAYIQGAFVFVRAQLDASEEAGRG